MGIQFRLGPNDHKPVEDFLSREHTGTDAITLDTKAARHQVAAAAAAVDAGLDVYWEPAAERLAEAGFGLDKFPLWNGQPYGIDSLSANQAARAALVDLTIEKHPAMVTHVTAPHFYVTDERTAHRNVINEHVFGLCETTLVVHFMKVAQHSDGLICGGHFHNGCPTLHGSSHPQPRGCTQRAEPPDTTTNSTG